MVEGVFKRSWQITKLTFSVINKDREIIWYPLLAGIFSLLFILVLLFPTLITSYLAQQGVPAFGVVEYLVLFVLYLGLAFIATFFNTCVVYTAKRRFEGGNATFSETIKFALSKVHLIFVWSLVSATVGIFLRMLDRLAQKAGPIGGIIIKILRGILGLMWSIITIFVVPAMVYYDLGPIDAIKKSIDVLKKTWGESIIRHVGLGSAIGLLFIVGIVLSVAVIVGGAMLGGVVGALVGFFIAVVYFVALFVIFNAANEVFNTALFVYGDSGKVPKGYNKEIMDGAFKAKI